MHASWRTCHTQVKCPENVQRSIQGSHATDCFTRCPGPGPGLRRSSRVIFNLSADVNGKRISRHFICKLHCVSKKGPTLKLSITLSNLNRFSKLLHCWKAYKFATKPIQHYPPHLRYVATLPREIRNSNFLQIFSRYGRKCKQIAF